MKIENVNIIHDMVSTSARTCHTSLHCRTIWECVVVSVIAFTMFGHCVMALDVHGNSICVISCGSLMPCVLSAVQGLSSSKKASKVEVGGPAFLDDVACLLQAPLPDALLEKLATVAFGTIDFGMSLNKLRGKTEAVLALADEGQRAARDCGASGQTRRKVRPSCPFLAARPFVSSMFIDTWERGERSDHGRNFPGEGYRCLGNSVLPSVGGSFPRRTFAPTSALQPPATVLRSPAHHAAQQHSRRHCLCPGTSWPTARACSQRQASSPRRSSWLQATNTQAPTGDTTASNSCTPHCPHCSRLHEPSRPNILRKHCRICWWRAPTKRFFAPHARVSHRRQLP